MLKLKISIHEFETPDGQFVGMNAGEYTGVFAPLPVSDEDKEGMIQAVQQRAEQLMAMESLPDDYDGDMTLDEIKASIRENITDTTETTNEVTA